MKLKIGMSALALLPLAGGVSMAAGQTGTVNYEFVNIRTNPSINDSVKFVVKKGDKVEILSEKDGWYNIKTSNGNGWIQKSAIKVSENSVARNIKRSPKTKVYKSVSNDILNLRAQASTNSDILAVLHKGDKLLLIEETIGWAKVRYNDVEGYVSTRFIEGYSSRQSNSNSNMRKIVMSNKLNMRKSTKITSERIATLKKGEFVEFISESNGWSKVSYKGNIGYVSSYYIADTDEPIIQNNSEEEVDQSLKIIENDLLSINENENNSFRKGNSFIKSSGAVTYKQLDVSLSDHVNMQLAKALNLDSSSGWKKVDYTQLYEYMNPDNYINTNSMMQFALLNKYTDDITVAELNAYLNRYCKPGNVFYNQGQAFINAARKNNINVLYLVAHSMLETGNGTSKLARGTQYNGKTVYNFFGIGAVDGNALAGGAATAYKNGWTSVAAGIDGASSWIASKYIHNATYGQNTLYEMKWSTKYTWHQYASDISWPVKIGQKMNDIKRYSSIQNELYYLVPQYR